MSARSIPALLTAPLSLIYGCIMAVRNLLFDFGICRTHHVAIPVISIGNLTVGGTGKTPMVGEVLHWAISRGHRAVVLTRGYKSGLRQPSRITLNSDEYFGDEPMMLKAQFPQIEVVVCPDRVLGAEWIIRNNLGDLIVLDDGFQHRWIARDLDILVVDASESPREHAPVPFGRGREFSFGRNRADVLFFTKANPVKTSGWVREWKWHARGQDQFFSDVSFITEPVHDLRKLLLVTAVATPESVRQRLSTQSASREVELMPFPDHHRFSSEDVQRINKRFHEMGGEGTALMVTTAKDEVKLAPFRDQLPNYQVLSLKIEIQEKARFYELLDQIPI
jgi:tetraacyldisaccharide 4'-kinase